MWIEDHALRFLGPDLHPYCLQTSFIHFVLEIYRILTSILSMKGLSVKKKIIQELQHTQRKTSNKMYHVKRIVRYINGRHRIYIFLHFFQQSEFDISREVKDEMYICVIRSQR